MPSIWNICEKIETVKSEKDNNIYHKAKLNVAIKEIKAENPQQKINLFIKIEEIKKSNFIKIYDYFDENETIYILFECLEDKINKLNEILYEEQNIVKEVSFKKHGGPIHITEINKLFLKGIESMCKIFIKLNKYSGNGTGFFCKLRHPKINLSSILLTNNHVLNEDFLKEGNIIEYEYNNNIINNLTLTKDRRVYTNAKLDYTCIEIFDSDNISNFFEIDENIIEENLDSLKNSEIFILQYPLGDEISFSQGRILSINQKRIIHSASTEKGSSGSPIILRNNQYNYKICGIHFGGSSAKEQNYACPLSEIINDLKKQVNNLSFNDNFHTIRPENFLFNVILLQDGRLSGCRDDKIIIYNKNNNNIDLNIKLQDYKNKNIEYHTQLKNGYIVACNSPIIILKLQKSLFFFETYEIIQRIYNDMNTFCQKVIELDDFRFAAGYANSMICFYSNKNNKNNLYDTKSHIQFIGHLSNFCVSGKTNLLKINDIEFVGSSKDNKCVQFFIGGEDDIVDNKLIENINSNGNPDSMVKHNDILLVGGQQCEGIYLISLKKYELIGKTQTNLFDIYSIINLTNGNMLAGVEEDNRNFALVEYKIENNELIEVKRKQYAHALNIFNIIERNGIVITNSNDGTIKFWK